MNVLTRICTCAKQPTTKQCSVSTATATRPHTRDRICSLFRQRITSRLRTASPPSADTEPLALAFGHPHGAGFIGAGADGLLRAALTEALTSKLGVSWVIATERDLRSLFDDAFNDALADQLVPRLHVAETLEDIVERLEFEADVIRALSVNDRPALTASTVLWFTAPGPDGDVVHEAMQSWPGTGLVPLIAGPWPYGPTYLVDSDGPRPLPRRPINLLTAQQATTKLQATMAA
ncbi:hypothetical protein [Actinomadura sp. WMMB 499]|uniref:hypothetical protein n=1 Tax=Actinomadura sp. WMMB 499 TaxID=1219491 RepID=UPI00124456BC|nr:hypothetical protein [Actinomadura sp. WMMB 499]QFG22901.1 hypothetical protein F7P10_19050 [Actinomadura sp. WMMB 499]